MVNTKVFMEEPSQDAHVNVNSSIAGEPVPNMLHAARWFSNLNSQYACSQSWNPLYVIPSGTVPKSMLPVWWSNSKYSEYDANLNFPFGNPENNGVIWNWQTKKNRWNTHLYTYNLCIHDRNLSFFLLLHLHCHCAWQLM